MYVLTALIALFQMNGSTLTGNAWTDAYLDKMVGVEATFYSLAWWVWAIVISVMIILAALIYFKVIDLEQERWVGGCCAGIVAVILAIWPLAEWISLFLIQGVANHFSATVGVTNAVPFIIYLLLYLSFGAG